MKQGSPIVDGIWNVNVFIKGIQKQAWNFAQKCRYLAWANNICRERVEQIVSNQYRNAYDRAAGALGAGCRLLGPFPRPSIYLELIFRIVISFKEVFSQYFDTGFTGHQHIHLAGKLEQSPDHVKFFFSEIYLMFLILRTNPVSCDFCGKIE